MDWGIFWYNLGYLTNSHFHSWIRRPISPASLKLNSSDRVRQDFNSLSTPMLTRQTCRHYDFSIKYCQYPHLHEEPHIAAIPTSRSTGQSESCPDIEAVNKWYAEQLTWICETGRSENLERMCETVVSTYGWRSKRSTLSQNGLRGKISWPTVLLIGNPRQWLELHH